MATYKYKFSSMNSASGATPRTGAYLYPWDIVGDPDCVATVKALGVGQVTLAAAYHSTRALTPRHPAHRVVTAAHAAVYYPMSEQRWHGRRLRPRVAEWMDDTDSFGTSCLELGAAGLAIYAWVVLMHNTSQGDAAPDITVRNAYGDAYAWALCPSWPEVRAYAAALAAESAERPGLAGIELESCGWYGFAHLSSHDKVGGVPLDSVHEFLMALCFCQACAVGYRAAGIDVDEFRSRVRKILDRRFVDDLEPSSGGDWSIIRDAVGEQLADTVLAYRSATASRLRQEVMAAVRDATPPGFTVLLHADVQPHRVGANVGVEVENAFVDVDGLVLACNGSRAEAIASVEFAKARTKPGGRIVANLPAVSGMNVNAVELADRARLVVAAGADELRFYHAGIASRTDLARIAATVTSVSIRDCD